MRDEERRMVPVSGQQENEMGRYEPVDIDRVPFADVQLPTDEEQILNEQDYFEAIAEERSQRGRLTNGSLDRRVGQERHKRIRLPRFKTVLGTIGVGAAVFIAHGLLSGGGDSFEGEVGVEETRVEIYQNVPIELAGIESDLNLDLRAGYDRTGPIPGVDINPVNNMYTLKQRDLTTETKATLTVEEMRVAKDKGGTTVTLSGEFRIGEALIDFSNQDFAGSDIDGTSLSIGNDKKDEIDNQALDILQASGGVAAACAIRSEEVQPLLTKGIANFLRIVNPNLAEDDKPLRVIIMDLGDQADAAYAQSIDELHGVVNGIAKKYSGKNDRFDVDTTQIEDCSKQDIRLVDSK